MWSTKCGFFPKQKFLDRTLACRVAIALTSSHYCTCCGSSRLTSWKMINLHVELVDVKSQLRQVHPVISIDPKQQPKSRIAVLINIKRNIHCHQAITGAFEGVSGLIRMVSIIVLKDFRWGAITHSIHLDSPTVSS